MADYSAETALALSLISESGTTVTIRRVVTGTYDPVADTDTGAATSDFVVAAAFLPLMTAGRVRDQFMATGGGVQSNSTLILIPSKTTGGADLPYVPAAGDTAIFGTVGSPNDKWWRIDSVGVLQPNLTPILYTIVMTKGAGTVE